MKKNNKEKTLSKAAVIAIAGLTALTVTPVVLIINTVDALNNVMKITIEETRKGLKIVDNIYDN